MTVTITPSPLPLFPPGPFQIIYADPAWVYNDKCKSHGGGAESHYRCTPIDEMARWEIPAAQDSVLFMWCTYPQLPSGLRLMESWGFLFKTVAFTWVKTTQNGGIFFGLGHHTRGNAEICLLGIRGKGLRRINASIRNTQLHPREEHSKKPAAFRTDIVRLYGDVPRLEMFAREKAPGWEAWGDEIQGRIL